MEEGYPFVGYDFYFSPDAVLEYVVDEEPAEDETTGQEPDEDETTDQEPETSAVKASVKSLGAELQLGAEHAAPVASVRVDLYNGPVNRVLVNNATFGF
jgi:hypothetical protein